MHACLHGMAGQRTGACLQPPPRPGRSTRAHARACKHAHPAPRQLLPPTLQLYSFLVRRTESSFNKVVLKRLFQSKANRAPLSLSKLSKFMENKVRGRSRPLQLLARTPHATRTHARTRNTRAPRRATRSPSWWPPSPTTCACTRCPSCASWRCASPRPPAPASSRCDAGCGRVRGGGPSHAMGLAGAAQALPCIQAHSPQGSRNSNSSRSRWCMGGVG